jgi:hypothetical protein
MATPTKRRRCSPGEDGVGDGDGGGGGEDEDGEGESGGCEPGSAAGCVMGLREQQLTGVVQVGKT